MDNWTTMGGYGLAHWVIFAFTVVVLIYPVGRILRRLGFSPYWSVLTLIPPLNVFALWILAFIGWPSRGGDDRG